MDFGVIEIKKDAPHQYRLVRVVNEMAYGRRAEADLIEGLRRVRGVALSLLAWDKKQAAGHVCFSPVSLDSVNNGHSFKAVALGTVCVLSKYQGMGLGARLIRRGLECCADKGYQAVFVLGDEHYFTGLGFDSADDLGFSCPIIPQDGRVLMVKELIPGALGGRMGNVIYNPLFAKMEQEPDLTAAPDFRCDKLT